MTIITGTADFQDLYQGLLAEIVIVDGKAYGVPITKLTADSLGNLSVSIVSGTVNTVPPILQGISGSVTVLNFPNPQVVSGSVISYDFPVYGQWDRMMNTVYSGTNLYHAEFFRGGSSGTLLAKIDMTYDANDNLLTIQRT